jgi:hypothetical protein
MIDPANRSDCELSSENFVLGGLTLELIKQLKTAFGNGNTEQTTGKRVKFDGFNAIWVRALRPVTIRSLTSG